MIRKWWRTYLTIAGIMLVLDWFLLWARFYPFGSGGVTKLIYRIINFPWSNIYFRIEAKTNSWWNTILSGRFEFLLNDEIAPFCLFLIIVFLQAMIFTLIILGLKKYWYRKSRSVLQSN